MNATKTHYVKADWLVTSCGMDTTEKPRTKVTQITADVTCLRCPKGSHYPTSERQPNPRAEWIAEQNAAFAAREAARAAAPTAEQIDAARKSGMQASATTARRILARRALNRA